MDLKKILISDPIYQKYKLSDFTDLEQINLFFYFEDEKFTDINFLDSYCPICKTKTVFNAIETLNRQEYNNMFLNRLSILNQKDYIDNLKEIGTFKREFSCSRNKNHEHNLIVIFKIIDEYFYKICQFPSIADISNPDIEKYRKFDIEVYKELNRAIGLASHGIGVAPFVYLRRVLEKYIINPIIQKKIEEDIKNKELISLNFKDKIDKFMDEIPSFLTRNKNIYSILSKGIHELEENECLKIFPIILSSIELILNEEIEKKEKLIKEEEISRLLNNLKI